jgi:hypothetical protein
MENLEAAIYKRALTNIDDVDAHLIKNLKPVARVIHTVCGDFNRNIFILI